jgi:hypothetical protein
VTAYGGREQRREALRESAAVILSDPAKRGVKGSVEASEEKSEGELSLFCAWL